PAGAAQPRAVAAAGAHVEPGAGGGGAEALAARRVVGVGRDLHIELELRLGPQGDHELGAMRRQPARRLGEAEDAGAGDGVQTFVAVADRAAVELRREEFASLWPAAAA